ncbi:MAG: 50S ribosomal protein L34e [Candidatus Bathycorpusculaceae bacterium]
MPTPHLRTRSSKRANAKPPSGGKRVRYKPEVASKPSCPICGKPLGGIAHLPPVKRRRLNRSKRRIWRPYGGNLCHDCLKTALKQSARIT